MSFKLHVAFSGLLHFVPNQDAGKYVRLCIVLPNAPNHNARVSALKTGRLELNGHPVTEEISFDNMRISLRLTKDLGVESPGPFDYQGPMIDGPVKGVIPFKDIAGTRANATNPTVVSANASAAVGVRAQILVEEGVFALDMPNGPAKLELPADLSGHVLPIDIAPSTFMTIAGVQSAQLVTTPLASSPGQEVVYDITDDGGGEAGILLSYLCTQMIVKGASPVTDDDFKFHYRLLNAPAPQQEAAGINLTPVPRVISLPPAPQAPQAPASGPFKALAANERIPGGFTITSLAAGGCNCAGAGANPLAFNLDAFVGKTVPAAVVMSSLPSSPATPVPPS